MKCVMNEAFRQLVDGDMAVSIDTGLRAAEKLQALTDARAGEVDVATMHAQMGRVIRPCGSSSHVSSGRRFRPGCVGKR